MRLNYCIATRKSLVAATNRKKRLQFAKERRDCLEQRQRIVGQMSPDLLSSELVVASKLEEKAHEALRPSCTVSTLQASGGRVIIWGLSVGPDLAQQH
ncbi:hypothetical protein AVEN_154907-1 [Araneus ventricosus]|uniref:Transposase Tc1-like domain-containing protein n=1 Tax=Araneus ventricosus TaxID=182803 RepID=A0A4Y2A9H9_ARAVE|nr:hypothetical protein AVEN_154907-1 [Araneus ventricosus]